MSTEQLVCRSDADGVATVELNRPDRRNAITGPLLDQLAETMTSVAGDESVEAVVLCGAGGAFCSGLDLDEYNADPPRPWRADAADSLRRAHVAIATCDAPVVVALERFAINGGAAFALAGDLVVVGDSAWLQVGEVHMGMNAPMNLAWLAARHPLSTVLRVVLAGQRLAGPELLAMQLAHEVVADTEVRARAHALALEMARCPPGSARRLKQTAIALSDDDRAGWFTRAAELAAIPDTIG